MMANIWLLGFRGVPIVKRCTWKNVAAKGVLICPGAHKLVIRPWQTQHWKFSNRPIALSLYDYIHVMMIAAILRACFANADNFRRSYFQKTGLLCFSATAILVNNFKEVWTINVKTWGGDTCLSSCHHCRWPIKRLRSFGGQRLSLPPPPLKPNTS